MAKLNRRIDWLIIEEMRPIGTRIDEDGQQWAEFDTKIRVRRWHPGYWLALIRAIVAHR